MDENNFKLNPFFQIINNRGIGTIIPESDEEREYLDEVLESVKRKVKRLSKEDSNILNENIKITRDTNTLKKSCEEFLYIKSKTTSSKVMIKYKQSVKYLIIFFGEKKLLKDIDKRETNLFRNFLLDVPKFYQTKEDLKNKDIKLLIQSKSKLLDKYEKQTTRTVDEVIVKAKTIFKYFEENNFIHKNNFEVLKKITKKGQPTLWEEFTEEELKNIFEYLKVNDLEEELKFCKFLFVSGLRRSEVLNLKVSNFDKEKNLIDVYGNKTISSKRILPIYQHFLDDFMEQIKDKNDDDFIFFNTIKKNNHSRHEKIGELINIQIKNVVKEDRKIHLNIHSFRKNFCQELYFSDEFTDLERKTLEGHEDKNDISDVHYLRGKRNYKLLQEKLNKVSFDRFWKDTKIDIDIQIF